MLRLFSSRNIYLDVLLAMAGFVNQADTPIRGLWGDIFILLNGLFVLAFFLSILAFFI